MTKLSELKRRHLADPVVRTEYDRACAEYSVLEAMIRARTDASLTQAEIAALIGTTQSAVARLEGGTVSPSISTLQKYAQAAGRQLKIEFI